MNMNYKHAIVYIWSRDIKKTLSFYENILGFKKAFESDGWIEMAHSGSYQCVSRNQQVETAGDLPGK